MKTIEEFLDKIFLGVFGTDAKRLVLNRLLDSYYKIVEEKLEKFLIRFVG